VNQDDPSVHLTAAAVACFRPGGLLDAAFRWADRHVHFAAILRFLEKQKRPRIISTLASKLHLQLLAMPSLRIPFPEKDQPSVIALRANRITIGRLPDNTIQIPDRTVSAHHAELIAENGHYRVHDVGATNGILVNGQLVSDFHLTEGCKLTFGGMECEFSPEAPQEEAIDATRTPLTRAEADALQQEITTLRAQVAAYRQESETLRQSHATDAGAATVPQSEFDRVNGELTAMTLKVVDSERELERIKTEFAVLRHDRENLQRALDEAKSKASEPAKVEAASPEAPAPEAVAETPSEPEAPQPIADEAPTQELDAAGDAVPEEPAKPTPAQTLPPPKAQAAFRTWRRCTNQQQPGDSVSAGAATEGARSIAAGCKHEARNGRIRPAARSVRKTGRRAQCPGRPGRKTWCCIPGKTGSRSQSWHSYQAFRCHSESCAGRSQARSCCCWTEGDAEDRVI
jgi:predicted component of type VI protein secretion system